MISIVTCSINEAHFQTFAESIRRTIGTPFEIVRIDNRVEQVGICAAYNKGAAKSKFDYLCFVHEDTVFHNRNWGQNVVRHLQNKETGLLGVAGSSYVPFAPSGWHLAEAPAKNRINLVQTHKFSGKPRERVRSNDDGDNRVFALDGVFLALRRAVFDKFKFNENIKGFHAYDLDLSLRVAIEYRNKVAFDVLLEHFSEGDFGADWFKNTLLVRESIKHDFAQTLDENIEYAVFLRFVSNAARFEPNALARWRMCLKFFSPRRIGRKKAVVAFLQMHSRVFRLRERTALPGSVSNRRAPRSPGVRK